MSEDANPLSPLENAADHAMSTAQAMSEQAGGNYAGQALSELERDAELEPEGELHPARFAHEVIDYYMVAAGDFMYGAGLTTDPQHDLGFSSALLARSACEYANRCWWLADPDIDVRERIARARAVWQNTMSEERAVLAPEVAQVLAEVTDRLDVWASRCDPPLPNQRLPGPTRLFELVHGEDGIRDYKWLCNATHGSLLTVMLRYHGVTRSRRHTMPTRGVGCLWLLATGSTQQSEFMSCVAVTQSC